MKHLLKLISEKAIQLGDFEFTQEQVENKWLGTTPVSESEIEKTEKRLGVELPKDFKEFLSITNGFSAPNTIDPTFEQISKIDHLKNIDSSLVEVYNTDGIENIGKQLEKSILIGGINEEQYFLLIPPNSTIDTWKYWIFANWHSGEYEHKNLESYFENVLNFMDEQIKLNVK